MFREDGSCNLCAINRLTGFCGGRNYNKFTGFNNLTIETPLDRILMRWSFFAWDCRVMGLGTDVQEVECNDYEN